MSQLEINRLNDQLSKNKSLKAKVDAAKTGEDLVAVAREAGFDVTGDDFQQLAADELELDQLEHVSGGVGDSSTRPAATQVAEDSGQDQFRSNLRGGMSGPAYTEQSDGSGRGVPPAFGS
jgi:predicted ribosomally synthesized peptide with nif11-like leader